MHLPVSSSKSPASRHGKHDRHPELPCNATSTRSRIFGAAVIRLSSDSRACSTHRLHLLQSICIHLSSRAFYTTQYLIRYRYQAVASLRDRHRQLSRLDFHQLDCSLVGCSSTHPALQQNSLSGRQCTHTIHATHSVPAKNIVAFLSSPLR